MDNRRGSAIVAVIVLVVVLGAILFFASKPFSTRVKEAARQATEWTPENITKDPVGYLTWALDECKRVEGDLKASTLALNTRRNQAERELAKKQAERDAYSKLVGEAKALYRKAKADDRWPAALRGATLTEAELKARIVEAHSKVKSLDDLIAAYKQSQKAMERQLVQISEKLTEAQKLKGKLSSEIEVAKVKQSAEGIGAITDQLEAMADTSKALVSSSGQTSSLEDMVAPTGQPRIDAEFDRIMSE